MPRVGKRSPGSREPTVWHLLAALALLAVCLGPRAEQEIDPEVWLLIDTRAETLSIMLGDRSRLTVPNIAIGRYGATDAKMRGDHRTPVGSFRIKWVQEDSRFHRFFGLDYPDLKRATAAMKAGDIDKRVWRRIQRAQKRGTVPPQDTPLGGAIGIHGIGAGDPRIHESFNWTNGCIALTNEQIDDLAAWVRLGTRVEIR